MNKFLLVLIGLCVVVNITAHVTIAHTDIIAAGEYAYVEIVIPHGAAGKYTSRIDILVPHGLLSAKPQAIAGWDITIENRNLLPAEQYVDHGSTVTTAVDKIHFVATTPEFAIANDNVERIGLQIRLGCSFSDSNTQSVWGDHYALWFKTVQTLSDFNSLTPNGTIEWIGIVSGNQLWGDGYPHPSPFLLIQYWEACNASAFDYKFNFLNSNIPFTGREKLASFPDTVEWISGQIDVLNDKADTITTQIEFLEGIHGVSKRVEERNIINPNKSWNDGGMLGGLVIFGIFMVLLVIALALGVVKVYISVSSQMNPSL